MSKVIKKRELLIGKEFEAGRFGKCTVLDYENNKKVTVMFHNPISIVSCTLGSLNSGSVKNPMFPLVCDKGYIGVGKYSTKDKKPYALWRSMLERAYSARMQALNPTYKGVEVCEEWLNFQNFAKWCYDQKFFNAKDKNGRCYDIDKDLLVRGNKIYSPDTCCFIPREVNTFLVKRQNDRGSFPIGVAFCKERGNFIAFCGVGSMSRKHLGRFETPEEAFQAYKQAKEDYAKVLIAKWDGAVDEVVIKALHEYSVSMGD